MESLTGLPKMRTTNGIKDKSLLLINDLVWRFQQRAVIEAHAALVRDRIGVRLGDDARRRSQFAQTRASHDADSLSSFRKNDLRHNAHRSTLATSSAISSNFARTSSKVIFFLLAHGPCVQRWCRGCLGVLWTRTICQYENGKLLGYCAKMQDEGTSVALGTSPCESPKISGNVPCKQPLTRSVHRRKPFHLCLGPLQTFFSTLFNSWSSSRIAEGTTPLR